MQKQVVIRRSLWGNILFILICSAFVVYGVIWWQNEHILWKILSALTISLFGVGGLCYFIFVAWKPIVVISNEGITIPIAWFHTFIPWGNIDRFEQVEQKGIDILVKEINIFVFDKKGICDKKGTTLKHTEDYKKEGKVPVMLTSLIFSFSFIKTKKAMELLQEFHGNYKAIHSTE